MSGLCITVLDLLYPHKFSTVLEMDYGTPFDRHTIIEDSHVTKAKKKASRPEEPTTSAFGGLFRKLSKRDRERAAARAAAGEGATGHPGARNHASGCVCNL